MGRKRKPNFGLPEIVKVEIRLGEWRVEATLLAHKIALAENWLLTQAHIAMLAASKYKYPRAKRKQTFVKRFVNQ